MPKHDFRAVFTYAALSVPRERPPASSTQIPWTPRSLQPRLGNGFPTARSSVMTFPRMLRVRQSFEADRLRDVSGEVARQLQQLRLRDKVRAGQTVAITAGSRGIANVALITKAICDHVRGSVQLPSLSPRWGATAEGPRRVSAKSSSRTA